jgi:hypothetical protein
MNNDKNIYKTTQFVNNVYDKLTYLDLYGNSVILFLFLTIFVFLVFSYCQVMQTRQHIADDWTNQRCKPQNIAFAGYITHPEGKTPFQYTGENFQFCVQNILLNITSYALEPFHFMINSLTELFNIMSDAVNKIREMMSNVRNSAKIFGEDVMSRILNIMTPIQTMMIALMDTFNKIQGVMTSGLYTVLGTYYTLKSLMGAILEFIIKILIALVIIIVGLWILPFTWPLATTMTAVFIGLSIPLAIIIYFMTEVLHIQTDAMPKLRCFDEETTFILHDQTNKKIANIEVGDILENNVKVTAKIKVSAKALNMYNLFGIIVSQSHKVKYNNEWISVDKHPDAKLMSHYNKPYLYCLNTSSKTISLNNIVFSDWDEIYDNSLDKIMTVVNMLTKTKYGDKINDLQNIHRYLDNGFKEHVLIDLVDKKKKISEINIGDRLENGGIVYGIVEIDTSELRNCGNLGVNGSMTKKLYNLLSTNNYFTVYSEIFGDYNDCIDNQLL